MHHCLRSWSQVCYQRAMLARSQRQYSIARQPQLLRRTASRTAGANPWATLLASLQSTSSLMRLLTLCQWDAVAASSKTLHPGTTWLTVWCAPFAVFLLLCGTLPAGCKQRLS